MCTPPEAMKKFEFAMKNQWMKEYLATPATDTDSLFYRQNTVNKTLTLPFYRHTDCHGSKNTCGCYPKRTSTCFPATAPLSCPPMLHRTKLAEAPRSPDDVILPSRATIVKNYTMKIAREW